MGINLHGSTGAAQAGDTANLAKLNVANKFENSNSSKLLNHGVKNGVPMVIDVRAGNAQQFTVGGPVTLSFTNWETSSYLTPLLLNILNAGSSTLTISGTIKWVNISTGVEHTDLAQYLLSMGRNPAAWKATGKERLAFWSEDGGVTIMARFQ